MGEGVVEESKSEGERNHHPCAAVHWKFGIMQLLSNSSEHL